MKIYEIRISDIIMLVSDFYFIPMSDVISENQTRELVTARQVICYMAKKHTKLSVKAIGNAINRDHTTVLYSVKHINELVTVDKKLRLEVDKINMQINIFVVSDPSLIDDKIQLLKDEIVKLERIKEAAGGESIHELHKHL